ncbi:hypothetical protein CXG81DRAFT_12392 [Caulochytrium protostelioides]|uniref:Cysteine desulfurase, mitosomal n=1 Tax=Caulochytrium protostelioides TaxID=1555241 RepID=A0A4P9X7A6_9FUNG|nr:hypothetical protein CXG81DRAFT_12392 [Caulochytrium protostelioides]|eukprot:RKP01105.1 hypothetical protein CXG81DRAFT_12392 [Caulochytrium protostelioides]
MTTTVKETSPVTGRPVYLDVQATTATDPRVLDAMLPYFTHLYGNPHSRTHSYGWETEQHIENAREEVRQLIGAKDKREVLFTSGATEANNTIIKGIPRFYAQDPTSKRRHIITTQTEHKCVLDACRVLETQGFEVTYLPVSDTGLIDVNSLAAAIRPGQTVLVSVMAINNEIGVIQPLEQIGQLCRKNKIFFHTDAAQAVGKIPIDVEAMHIDALSISGHKIYGPKGVGAMYVRRRPRVRLEPLMHGGGQERGLRSGTVPTPLAVGLGAACRLAREDMAYDYAHVARLSDRLYRHVTAALPDVLRNGPADPAQHYPGCLNLSFAYVEGESLMMALKEVALSSGSACTSASLEPSYVLRALGRADEMAHSSVRFGLGRFTTEREVDFVVDRVIQHVARLRDLSPLWEMVQEGIDLSTIKWSDH